MSDAPKVQLVTGNFSTLSATGVAVLSSGGDFTIMLTDLRPQTMQDGSIANVAVEIGRFRLTPDALLKLEKQVAEAKAIHERIFGKMPTADEVTKGYQAANAVQGEWHV